MGQRTLRRLLKYLAGPLIVAQVGCAARGVHVAPTPPPLSMSEEDRKSCAEFAKREAKALKTKSAADAAGEGLAAGLVAGFYFLNPGVVMLMGPALAIGGAIDQSLKNSAARKMAYAGGEVTCLRPAVLAETLGPEHPDVASALRSLAYGYANQTDYAAAELLYLRALGIQERILGPESEEVAMTLHAYAEVLQVTHREEQATELKARADAIRAGVERRPGTEVAGAKDATADAEELHTASTSIPQPVEEGE